MFSFEFAALSYVDPQRNQYRYMLEPLDHSWNLGGHPPSDSDLHDSTRRNLHAARSGLE
jgi:hypothetical protein